ncbi:MAG: hypothetical protein V1809_13125 [Planctomycetota bacterium]
MKSELARKINQVIGGVVFLAASGLWRLGKSSFWTLVTGDWGNLTAWGIFLPWVFALGSAICLLFGKMAGVWLLLGTAGMSVIGSTFCFIPFLGRALFKLPYPQSWFATGLVNFVLAGIVIVLGFRARKVGK